MRKSSMEGKVMLISLLLLWPSLSINNFYKSEYYTNTVFGLYSIKINVTKKNGDIFVTKSGISGKYQDIKFDMTQIPFRNF